MLQYTDIDTLGGVNVSTPSTGNYTYNIMNWLYNEFQSLIPNVKKPQTNYSAILSLINGGTYSYATHSLYYSFFIPCSSKFDPNSPHYGNGFDSYTSYNWINIVMVCDNEVSSSSKGRFRFAWRKVLESTSSNLSNWGSLPNTSTTTTKIGNAIANDSTFQYIDLIFTTSTSNSGGAETAGIMSYKTTDLRALTIRNFSGSSVPSYAGCCGILAKKQDNKILIMSGTSYYSSSPDRNLPSCLLIDIYADSDYCLRRWVNAIDISAYNQTEDITYAQIKKFKHDIASHAGTYAGYDSHANDFDSNDFYSVSLPYRFRDRYNCPIQLTDGTTLFLVGNRMAVPFDYTLPSS